MFSIVLWSHLYCFFDLTILFWRRTSQYMLWVCISFPRVYDIQTVTAVPCVYYNLSGCRSSKFICLYSYDGTLFTSIASYLLLPFESDVFHCHWRFYVRIAYQFWAYNWKKHWLPTVKSFDPSSNVSSLQKIVGKHSTSVRQQALLPRKIRGNLNCRVFNSCSPSSNTENVKSHAPKQTIDENLSFAFPNYGLCWQLLR